MLNKQLQTGIVGKDKCWRAREDKVIRTLVCTFANVGIVCI